MENNLENEDFDELKEEEEYHPPVTESESRAISYNISNSVEVLINKINNQEIDLSPEFQRDFVWDRKRASFFIDSLIIGLPIPSIFLGKRKEEESFFVIDGQQRLKTIISFFKEEYNSGKSKVKFKLIGLDKKEWNNLSYSELPEIVKRKFRNAIVNTTIIENIDKDPIIVNDIFHRLNTGGMPLNDQEIRNCIYRGEFNKFLIELNQNEEWRKLLGKIAPSKRFLDLELILRFSALHFNYEGYKEPMRNYLNLYMEDSSEKFNKYKELKEIFDETIHIIYSTIGPDAFKINKYFNRAVCDAVLIGTSFNIKNGTLTSNLKAAHKKLLKEKSFFLYVSESTTSSSNVRGRIELAKKNFSSAV